MEGLGGRSGTYRPIDSDADEDHSERQSNNFSLKRLFRSRKKMNDKSGLGGTHGTYRPIDPDDDAPADEERSGGQSNRFSLSKFKRLFHLKKKRKSKELPQMLIPMSRPKPGKTEETPIYQDEYHLKDERYKQLEQDHFKFLKTIGFTVDEKLGAGSFGDVYRVRQFVGEGVDREMACKVVSLGKFEILSYSEAAKAMKQEDKFFRQVDHAHIVKRFQAIPFYDHKTQFPEVIHILHFMEVMESDLFELICERNKLNEEETRDWLAQVVSAVAYLHDKNICHLDIKPENILYRTRVDEKGEERKIYKLSDFGNAIHFVNDRCLLSTAVQDNWMGTWDFTGPEVMGESDVLAKPLDIYALGITVCDSIAGKLFDPQELVKALNKRNQNQIKWYDMSEAFAELVATMISDSPSERPSIQFLRTFLGQTR